jgi:hypothetical protein
MECSGCGRKELPLARLRFTYQDRTVVTVPLCFLCRCDKRAQLRERRIRARLVT